MLLQQLALPPAPRLRPPAPDRLAEPRGVTLDRSTSCRSLATFVTPDQRREGGFEARLQRRYAGLVAAGGRYTWEDSYDDYRLGIADYWLFYPIWDEVNGSGRDYWWPKLRCLVGAYRDLECAPS